MEYVVIRILSLSIGPFGNNPSKRGKAFENGSKMRRAGSKSGYQTHDMVGSVGYQPRISIQGVELKAPGVGF
jgi:hypothetical protein